LKVKEINDRVTGHFMCIKKETWNKIYSGVRDKCRGLGILSVDTVISRSVLEAGLKIRLMEGLYVLHYYRLGEGPKRKQMLG
jgi:GT2 family glycosyltransferase